MSDTRHPFEGLMRFAQQEPWAEEFHWVLSEHVGRACETFELETLDDLAKAAGQAFGTIMGCVLEDLMTRESENGSVIDAYLATDAGGEEPDEAVAMMRSVQASDMVLYRFVETTPGESFQVVPLEDDDAAPASVFDTTASRLFQPGNIAALRVIQAGDRLEMTGGILPYTAEMAESVLETLATVREAGQGGLEAQLAAMLGEANGMELDEAEMAEMADLLAKAEPAAMLTDAWLHGMLAEERGLPH